MMACMKRCMHRSGAFFERRNADITYCLLGSVLYISLSLSLSPAAVALPHTRCAYDSPSMFALDALENEFQMYKKPQQRFNARK